MRVPEANRWGESARIWPSGNAWVKQNQDLAEMVEEWRGLIEEDEFPVMLCSAWVMGAVHLAGWAPWKCL